MDKRIVIVVTNKLGDAHAEKVIDIIAETSDCLVYVIDTEYFGRDWSVFLDYENNKKSFIKINSRNIKIHLGEIVSIWWRKPTPVNVKYMKDEAASFIFRESNDCIYGMLWAAESLGATIINHPFFNYYASIKPKQISVAKSLNLLVPETYVTNDPFFAKQKISDGKMVAKGVSMSWAIDNNKNYSIFVKEIDEEKKRKIHILSKCPATLQGLVDQRFGVRIVHFFGKSFCFRIINKGDDIDWRKKLFSEDISYEFFEVDDNFRMILDSYNNEFSISFSVFDFVLSRENELFFLESNPNGQWLWLDEEINFAISNELAKILTNKK